MSEKTSPAQDDPGALERRLQARIAELEAEVEAEREAAAAARSLVTQVADERVNLRDQIEELRAEVVRLSSLRGSLGALQRAAKRRVRR